MRVTAETKSATRLRILEAGRQLFAASGFENCTTRQIADAAGIATGTLFNYFPTKETVLASLASEAVAGTYEKLEESSEGSLEEELFGMVAAGLRKLKPFRKHLPVLLETSLSPLATAADGDAQSLRAPHLEMVTGLAKKHGFDLSPLALQLYWTLHTGVLMFWSNDRSPKQEDTLALLDQSLAMFAGWLQRDERKEGTNHAPDGQ